MRKGKPQYSHTDYNFIHYIAKRKNINVIYILFIKITKKASPKTFNY